MVMNLMNQKEMSTILKMMKKKKSSFKQNGNQHKPLSLKRTQNVEERKQSLNTNNTIEVLILENQQLNYYFIWQRA